ncbi:hypothetical protein FKP32DRAFT_1582114, partial [Trametes sanguinea]
AVMWTAVVWIWNSDLRTGNFVLPGEVAPAKVMESRVCPGALCQFSYGVDTFSDKTLYDAQTAFEAHVSQKEGFNRTRKPRRKWQEGGGSFDTTYIFTAPVFARRGPWHKERRIPYDVPSPIRKATENPKVPFYANPDRPQIFEAINGSLHDIATCDPPALQYGDLVWISFAVEFIVGSTAWHPNFTPVEIVRVGTVAPHLVGSNAALEGVNGRPVPSMDPRQRLQVGQAFTLSTPFY